MKKKLILRLLAATLIFTLGAGEALAAAPVSEDASTEVIVVEDLSTDVIDGEDELAEEELFEEELLEELTEAPSAEEPSTEEPSTEEPSTEEPSTEESLTEESLTEEEQQFLNPGVLPVDVEMPTDTDNPEDTETPADVEEESNEPPEDLTYSFNFMYQKPDDTIALYPSSVTASKVVELAYPIIFQGEGDYSTVTPNDNGSGSLSLGRIQWHGNRALYMVREIVETDPKKAYKLLGKDFYYKVTNSSTSWASYVPNAEETALLRTFLQQMPKTAQVQDKMAKADIAGYINYGMGYGLRNVPALIYFADLYNQSPKRAKEIITVLVNNKICKSYASITLNEIYISALANTTMNKDAYMNRRTRVYRQAASLGYPYCTSADSMIPCVTSGFSTSTYVGEAWLQWALNTYAGATLNITDAYDAETIAAVSAFQTANGIKADGQAGKSTLKALATIIINSGIYEPANAAQQATVISLTKTKWEVNDTDESFAIEATSNNSQAPFVFASSDSNVVAITSDGKIDPVGPGTVTVTVSQAATAGFLPASKTVTIVVYDNDVTSYTVPTTTLAYKKSGMKKQDVMWLQAALNKTIQAGLLVDGDYGASTDKAVKEFQTKVGTTVDGEVGPNTRSIMVRFLTVANSMPTVTATGSTTGVTLKWNKDSNASYYKVYRKAAGGGWTVLATITNINTLSYTDKTGTAGTTYHYTVQSYYKKGTLYVHSKYDPNITAMKKTTGGNTGSSNTGEYPVPTRALKIGSSGDDVKWMQAAINQLLKTGMPVDGAFGSNTEKYVKQFQTAVGTVADGVVGANTRSIIQRYLAVAGNMPKVTATSSESGVSLTWNKDDNASYYKVYRKVAGGSWKVLSTITDSNTLSYGDKTGTAGTTYYYTVQSYYQRGTLYVHSKYDPNITAMKKKPADSTDNSGNGDNPGSTTDGTYPVPTRNLKVGCVGDDVKWLQTAINQLIKVSMPVDGEFGNNTAKYVKQFQTAAGVTADGIVGATTRGMIQRYLAVAGNMPRVTASSSETGVTLNWNKDNNANYYKVYRKVAGGSWKVLATITDTNTLSYVDKTGTTGTTYYYTVQSYYKSGSLYVHSKYDATITGVKKETSDNTDSQNGYPVPTRVLKIGCRGDDVKWMQAGINQVLGSNMPVDGDFGNNTANYVKQFQTKYGLVADGIFGAASRGKLQSLYH